jgi:hypothetical protein
MAVRHATAPLVGLFAAALIGCGPAGRNATESTHAPPRATAAASASASATASASASASASVTASDSAPTASPSSARAEAAERVLFLATHLRTTELREACPATLAEVPRIRCLLSLRYADETESKKLALVLYDETGSLAGLLPEETTEDGRGQKVQLKPARPIGANRQHLQWILDAMREYTRFLDALRVRQKRPVAMRDRPLDFRFFYTDKGGSPSAFAVGQNIGYNLFGAVNVHDEAVRDTLFHEIFHLNDAWHEGFSARALAPIEARILERCKGERRCLLPYAPTDTTMNGKLYAFIDGGTGREYAAEIALRYFREQRLALEGKPLPIPPFKCGPPENAEAMTLVADEFFGGVDVIPECP